MPSLKRICGISVLMLICWTISSGCDFTLGPKVKTNYVFVYPGQPLIVAENSKVKVMMDQSGAVDNTPKTVDIGGWYAMPQEHYHALARAAGIEE